MFIFFASLYLILTIKKILINMYDFLIDNKNSNELLSIIISEVVSKLIH
jgi:hypothetical protein